MNFNCDKFTVEKNCAPRRFGTFGRIPNIIYYYSPSGIDSPRHREKMADQLWISVSDYRQNVFASDKIGPYRCSARIGLCPRDTIILPGYKIICYRTCRVLFDGEYEMYNGRWGCVGGVCGGWGWGREIEWERASEWWYALCLFADQLYDYRTLSRRPLMYVRVHTVTLASRYGTTKNTVNTVNSRCIYRVLRVSFVLRVA